MKTPDFIGETTIYDKKEMLEERKPKSWLKSVPATAVDLKRLVLRGMNASFDSLSTAYPFESFSFTKLRSVYRMRTGTELTDSDFVSFELVDEKNMLTNAGAAGGDKISLPFRSPPYAS